MSISNSWEKSDSKTLPRRGYSFPFKMAEIAGSMESQIKIWRGVQDEKCSLKQ